MQCVCLCVYSNQFFILKNGKYCLCRAIKNMLCIDFAQIKRHYVDNSYSYNCLYSYTLCLTDTVKKRERVRVPHSSTGTLSSVHIISGTISTLIAVEVMFTMMSSVDCTASQYTTLSNDCWDNIEIQGLNLLIFILNKQ